MSTLIKAEICLEIDDKLESTLLDLNADFEADIITQDTLARKVGHEITSYLKQNDIVLVKIFRRTP